MLSGKKDDAPPGGEDTSPAPEDTASPKDSGSQVSSDTSEPSDTAPEPDTGEEPDRDGDGFTVSAGDCDDTDPRIHPGGREVCNLTDDDCDGEIDEESWDAGTSSPTISVWRRWDASAMISGI